jgi:hypothetical protein
VLLLCCPEQGGWHTGVRFEGRWLAQISTEIELRPTHWLPALLSLRASISDAAGDGRLT